jgi:hypothetical protein
MGIKTAQEQYALMFQDVGIAHAAISSWYKNRTTKRSGVPLINHINEGLSVLRAINSSAYAQAAFCLHPLVQHDDNLRDNMRTLSFSRAGKQPLYNPHALMLVMEYRSVANAFLSDQIQSTTSLPVNIRLSPLSEVNDMLIADKVQNYKDFLTYHAATHPRAKELDLYFRLWLDALKISPQEFERLCTYIDIDKLSAVS